MWHQLFKTERERERKRERGTKCFKRVFEMISFLLQVLVLTRTGRQLVWCRERAESHQGHAHSVHSYTQHLFFFGLFRSARTAVKKKHFLRCLKHQRIYTCLSLMKHLIDNHYYIPKYQFFPFSLSYFLRL